MNRRATARGQLALKHLPGSNRRAKSHNYFNDIRVRSFIRNGAPNGPNPRTVGLAWDRISTSRPLLLGMPPYANR